MSKERKEPFGRRIAYNNELAEIICERIATSTISIGKLCEMYEDMPDESTIYKWRHKHAVFGDQYTRAKQRQAELTAEKILEFCDVPTYQDEHGVERVDSGRVALQRLKVDSIKWQASKLAPKIYGDKVSADIINGANTTEVAEKVAKLIKDSEREY